MRKNASLTIKDNINVYLYTKDSAIVSAIDKFDSEFKKDTLTNNIFNEKKDLPENQNKNVKVGESDLWIGIEKV